VGAWLKREVGRGAAGCVACGSQGLDFGVGASELLVPPLADHGAIPNENATYHGIGFNAPLAPPGQFEGTRHVTAIVVGSHRRQGVQMADFAPPAGCGASWPGVQIRLASAAAGVAIGVCGWPGA
jgi:hypothetical protein